jgi:hypothetical protein
MSNSANERKQLSWNYQKALEESAETEETLAFWATGRLFIGLLRQALLEWAASHSELGVGASQGSFAVVTRIMVGFAAKAALLEFSSDFSGSHLVSRCSSGNPIKDRLSGIVWLLHGFVLQPWAARGIQGSRSS